MGAYSAFLDILFPPRCVFCRRFLRSGVSRTVCDDCMHTLPYTERGGEKTGEFFSICVSPLYYEDTVRESLHRFKFKDATGYSKVYGKLLADCIRDNLAGRYDLIGTGPQCLVRPSGRPAQQSRRPNPKKGDARHGGSREKPKKR